ncbi:MAG: hypothetical protein ACTSWY_07505 [Promethearchaeota archaeon]
MPEPKAELFCIILDASMSIYQKNYTPNLLEACKKAILTLVKIRSGENISTGFGFIVVGQDKNGDPKNLINFEDRASEEDFRTQMEGIDPGEDGKIGEGIGLAIKMHIDEIKNSGVRVPKIILISDGNITPNKSKVTPKKMASLAKGLEIEIDCIHLGEVEPVNIMKQISEVTGGSYYHCKDMKKLLLAVTKIAQKKTYEVYPSSKNSVKILEKIAVPLITEMELNKEYSDIVARIRGTADYKKCGICFQEICPICKNSFQICGRYCPKCGKGYHIHCFAGWAENEQSSGGKVGRCPHCLYLIKVPGEISMAQKMHRVYKRARETGNQPEDETEQYKVGIFLAKDLGDTAIYNACPVCSNIFDEDEQVVKCGNPLCNAVYHINCFEHVKNKSCKMCGKKLLEI